MVRLINFEFKLTLFPHSEKSIERDFYAMDLLNHVNSARIF